MIVQLDSCLSFLILNGCGEKKHNILNLENRAVKERVKVMVIISN